MRIVLVILLWLPIIVWYIGRLGSFRWRSWSPGMLLMSTVSFMSGAIVVASSGQELMNMSLAISMGALCVLGILWVAVGTLQPGVSGILAMAVGVILIAIGFAIATIELKQLNEVKPLFSEAVSSSSRLRPMR